MPTSPDASRPPGRWDPAGYAHHAGFVPELGLPVLDLLAPRPGERVLDLGCGDGALTAQLAATGAVVVGLDASPEMAERARARGLDIRVGSADALAFAAEFDAVFSNAALHWVRDQDAMVAGVARALKPGGRFVAEMGGFGNVAAEMVALLAVLARRGLTGPGLLPWVFPTAEEHAARLQAHGFVIESLTLFSRPTPLPTGMAGWFDTFAGSVFARLDPDDRIAARDEAVALLRPALCDQAGHWTADYVRLRFAARLPA